MSSFNIRWAGQMLPLYISLVSLTLANPFITPINPVGSTNFTDQLRAGYYALPMTDDRGNVHDMIISTVSLDSWFATTASTCPGTPNPDPHCGWNPNALYDPAGAPTNGINCSIGVKSPVNQYTECYAIVPGGSITLGDNTAQNPGVPLYAKFGLLLNSTWDGSQQSGMLGLAAPIDFGPTGPWNPILGDISNRYAQSGQFTLAFKGGPGPGGWFTVGDALPPDALPLTDPSVFSTPMENSTINGRTNNLYVVTASLAILGAPNIPEQYVIDSGDIYLRVPSAVAQTINSAWSPAGKPTGDGTGRWTVACNAAAPTIGLTIGGHLFNIDKADLLVEQDNVCWSSVIDEQNGPYTLGLPLLLNVVVSFNLNHRTMYWQEPAGQAGGPSSSSALASSARSSAPAVDTSPSKPPPTGPAVAPTSSQSSPLPDHHRRVDDDRCHELDQHHRCALVGDRHSLSLCGQRGKGRQQRLGDPERNQTWRDGVDFTTPRRGDTDFKT